MFDEVGKLELRLPGTDSEYGIVAGSDLIVHLGDWARSCLGKPGKVMVVSNPRVFGLYGEAATESLRRTGFDAHVWLMRDGERYKNFRSYSQLLSRLGELTFSRTDAVVALGGGVVGDLAGFAAGTFLRGIRFLQVPTTLLAMIDSSVGGKTGINLESGKNLVGAFHQPSGVLIDVSTLRTLPRREVVAGYCEAVKHAILAGGDLFDETRAHLSVVETSRFKRVFESRELIAELAGFVLKQASFKASVVIGDQTEDVSRTDGRSRKVLNLGHTLAHSLEKVTAYRYFRHGEAVGWGLRFAGELSKSLELIHPDELNLLNDVVRLVGELPDISKLDAESIVQSFASDKKNVTGKLQWILLKGIGVPVIVASDQIPELSIRACLDQLIKNTS